MYKETIRRLSTLLLVDIWASTKSQARHYSSQRLLIHIRFQSSSQAVAALHMLMWLEKQDVVIITAYFPSDAGKQPVEDDQ